MKLVVATPLDIVVDIEEVASVTAEDASGRFGLLPGHADLLTVLDLSVLSWRKGELRGHCAVRGGVLTVTGGREVAVSTREAVVDPDLDRLAGAVLARFRAAEERERGERTEAERIQLALIRRMAEALGTGPGAANP